MSRAGLGAVALLALGASEARAWSATGHRVIGRLAENQLSVAARAVVGALLAPDSLTEATTWADEVRPDPAMKIAETWHYINLEDAETLAGAPRNPAGDILEALARFEATLADRSRPAAARREALLWIAHLVGDLHQPLHVGRGSDRGGNSVVVLWRGEPSNLHEVWDRRMIEDTGLSFSELAEFLDPTSETERAAWRQGGVSDWAAESLALRATCYEIGDGRLGSTYSFTHLPTVRLRLRQAGVRLAHVLERALSHPSDRSPPAR